MPEPDPSGAPAAPAPWIYRGAQPLALGVTLLLFAQWPLREAGAGGGAYLANDLAQVMFALYVSVAVSFASLRNAHVATHPQAMGASRWRRIGAALLPLPWCLWLVLAAAAPGWRALLALERFPESFNPGYFLIRAAPLLLGGLLAGQSLLALRRAWRR